MTSPGAPIDPVSRTLRQRILPDALAVARLEAGSRPPEWLPAAGFASVTRTARELSIVCDERAVPAAVQAERGFRALEVAGPLDFALTGILLRVAEPLAREQISIFSVSTFDTDYVLVRASHLDAAVRALEAAGHVIDSSGTEAFSDFGILTSEFRLRSSAAT